MTTLFLRFFGASVFFCFLSVPCESQAVPTDTVAIHSATQEIVALGKRTNPDAFVIFEAAPTDRFVQFANVGEIVFDIPVQSVVQVGSPSVVRRGSESATPPAVTGETITTRFVAEEEVTRLRAVLDRYGLNSSSTFEASHDFMGGVIGWSETIRGAYSVPPEQTSEFLESVFGEAYGLTDYSIRAEAN